MKSERCTPWYLIREKQEVAFDWLNPAEREAESGFGWAMKDNGVEPLCTQERVQQNSVGQWVGKEGWGSGYSYHNEGWKTLKNPSMEPRPSR
ncbi:hypothetical protein TNCV_4310871 [Trichonephila clavipes]|nr:hypothetical protein TNCV_4310871 [Trichonephila clavipes]